jgi:tetratricopeptide (TPR) repeat protein
LCGYLPVALQAAGSYLARIPGSSPKKYIEELQDESKRLKAIGKMGVQEDVLTKFSLSYSRLDPETAKVFRRLSVFPADFFSQAEEAVCQDEGHQHLIELFRWSLAEYQRPDEESEGRYHLHDLVRLFASEKLSEEDGEGARDEARQRHAEHFRDVLSSATDLYEKGNVLAGLNAFDLERMNIESAWAWAKENQANSDEAASICSSLLNWPYLLELRQHPKDRISWRKTALAASQQLNDRRMEGVHLSNLGNDFVALSDTEKASKCYDQALAVVRKVGNRKSEGAILGNLGSVCYFQGDAHKAIEHYDQALTIAREIGDKRNEGIWLGNLGLAHAALGDARKAIEYYEQAQSVANEIDDLKNKEAILDRIGLAYADLGDVRKAIEYHEQALVIARRIGDRGGEYASLNNLGLDYAAIGDSRQAIEYYKQALVIACEIEDRRGEGAIQAAWAALISH